MVPSTRISIATCLHSEFYLPHLLNRPWDTHFATTPSICTTILMGGPQNRKGPKSNIHYNHNCAKDAHVKKKSIKSSTLHPIAKIQVQESVVGIPCGLSPGVCPHSWTLGFISSRLCIAFWPAKFLGQLLLIDCVLVSFITLQLQDIIHVCEGHKLRPLSQQHLI